MDRHSSLRVSDADRHRATEVLQVAYADGRMDEQELDQRLSSALQAHTRGELSVSLSGLPARVGPVSPPAPTGNPHASVAGGLAHLSAFVLWVFGPLMVYAASPQGSAARRHAAEAFNFQVIAVPLFVVLTVIGEAVLPALIGPIAAVLWIGWFLLTIIGSARAFAGQPWTNPVQRIIVWRPLDPGSR